MATEVEDSHTLLMSEEMPLWENALEVDMYVFPVDQGIYKSV